MNDFDGPCNLCGGRNFRLLYRGNLDGRSPERFSQYAWWNDLYACRDCGLISQAPLHDEQKVYELVAAEKYLDEPIGELNVREKAGQFETLIRIMNRRLDLSGACLLDIGANTGVFLNTVRPLVKEIAGVEPSAEACAVARTEFGLDIRPGTVSELDLPDGEFDIVTMWDVIEHLYDPLADLARIRRLLKPGGTLFVSTHDVGTLFAKLAGRAYPMFMYQHFFHFTPATLGAMAEKAGYNSIAIDRFRKSWSLRYLMNLPEKNWPESGIARRFARAGASDSWTMRRRIAFPLREFFVLSATRA